MHYGITLPNVYNFAEPHLLADLAHTAEEAGWDGVFLWDTLHYLADGQPVAEAWISLTAMAMRTRRVKLGTMVTAPTRRRPQKLAREAVTLDHVSNGRFILGVGIGDIEDKGFTHFGEVLDAKQRAGMLDESLEIIQGLWSGEPFSYSGKYYQVDEIQFLPTPLQKPRIPIWVAGTWPNKGPMKRAARWDGVHVFSSPEGIAPVKRFMDEHHTAGAPFDIVVSVPLFEAARNAQARAALREAEQGGATWLLEFVMPNQDVDAVYAALRQGPPSL
ncbi:luciferase-like monooxygenase [Thermosporothrix hazakensis]|jgi:alkanesulfonate monooxygenase SsuD/methylene tetrahydromethanopterin reductase-like flavin-dependent oxidoreductase (luciferase family)|uniref:Luciferase-like monooxygenase n=1 Tax=Thermosporothrix hazakensis TaxID=644383 RepID=A0A326U9B4_THEHA|nr:LLM class flavin-dependent oxidoreductase [Thermosporothrix hazakensis]PZW31236.1 luciferase-like monooxygenase [Thermosporothrix hazakensis]GCE50854.1 luciferase-like protein [Thermosporothrix hazakensis]